MFAIKNDEAWVELNGPFVKDGIQYPANWVELATTEERAAIGVAEVSPPDTVAPGLEITGREIAEVDGLPRLQFTTRPYPREIAEGIAWQRVKHEFERRVRLGAATPHGVFDMDDTARTNIGGAVQMAMILGDDFAVDWTRHDNTPVSLDAASMTTVGLAVGSAYTALNRRKQELRAIVENLSVEDMLSRDVVAWWDEEPGA